MSTKQQEAMLTKNNRSLMELAIEVMQESVHEPRHDEKPAPNVGAVLLKQDGSYDTACRGELRYGDHAEFTVLERKNRGNKLDGCTLFCTLEPCAPGARNTPKISCAERIFNARIKEVWIGIEDPDPTVAGKGIQYLQNSGIKVHMFDRDLQEEIRKNNNVFLGSALKRAEEAKKSIQTSPSFAGEIIVAGELSQQALEEFRSAANINYRTDSAEFQNTLVDMGILKKANDSESQSPTGFGLLLFGQKPGIKFPQARLLATIHYAGNKEEAKDFDGPMVLVPKHVEKWLKDKLPNVIDRNSMQRKEVPAIPFEMIREAVVNALIHRDYDNRGAKCHLIVHPDKIEIKSPGRPPSPITVEQLKTFSAPMLSRNPELHYVFSQMEMAEERGLGLKSLKARAEELGLPLPTYTYDDPYLTLTLYLNQKARLNVLVDADKLKSLSAAAQETLQFLLIKGSSTRKELEEHFEVDERKMQRVLKELIVANLLKRIGAGPNTHYEVSQQ